MSANSTRISSDLPLSRGVYFVVHGITSLVGPAVSNPDRKTGASLRRPIGHQQTCRAFPYLARGLSTACIKLLYLQRLVLSNRTKTPIESLMLSDRESSENAPKSSPPILSNQNIADHLSDLAETLADWARLHNHIDVLQAAAERLRETPDATPALPRLVSPSCVKSSTTPTTAPPKPRLSACSASFRIDDPPSRCHDRIHGRPRSLCR
jgi:hypothetical protein